jgi:hypothetical protein
LTKNRFPQSRAGSMPRWSARCGELRNSLDQMAKQAQTTLEAKEQETVAASLL